MSESMSLEEEGRLRREALPAWVSPGAYREGGGLIYRVFADVAVPERDPDTLRKSRFTRARLKRVQRALADLAAPGLHFGIVYDAASDSVLVVGNLTVSQIPAEVRASGEVQFEFSADGGRQGPAGENGRP